MMTIYNADGERIPFDPLTMGAHLGGCLFCRRPITVVGVFIPDSEPLKNAVLRLRTHPVPERTTSAFSYGLCERHIANPEQIADLVEAWILDAASRVRPQ
jgi:hypothetical protein